MRRHRPALSPLLVAFGDFLILNGAFLIAFWLRFVLNFAFTEYPPPPFAGYLKALLVLNYCCLFLFVTQGIYRRERFHNTLDEYNSILKSLTGSLIFVASLTFFVRGFEYSRLVTLYAWVLSSVGFGAFRYTLWRWERYLRSRAQLQFRTVIVGVSEMSVLLAKKFRDHPQLGYRVVGFLGKEATAEFPRLGDTSDLPKLIDEKPVDAVFVSDPNIDHYELLKIVEFCETHEIPVAMVPSIYDLLVSYRDVSNIDGVPIVSLEENTIPDVALTIKRVFDIAFSVMVFVVTGWAWLLIIWAIRRDSPGPAIFVQERAGLNGKPFRMFKFRTMVQDAEARLQEVVPVDSLEEPVFKVQNDPRVTRVGRFLRDWSLDELPQFLNVLIGNMSVVGPRPEEVGMVARYNVWQRRRLKVKPGITGLQQISNRGCGSLAERVKYDIYYIRQYSFLLDIKIILKTVFVVFGRHGTTS